MPIGISLKCKVCGEPHSQHTLPKWAQLIGYDHLAWIDPGADLPAGDQGACTDICPEVGARRLAHVQAPFEATSNQPFWALFQPGLSLANGRDEYPDEIERSALVRCELTEVLREDGVNAWIAVWATDVVPLPDLIDRFEATEGSVDLTFSYTAAWETSWKDWLFVEGNAEGDLGEWVLVHRRPDGDHLVLHAGWDFHRSIVEAGNMRLKGGEAESLCGRMKISSTGNRQT